MDDQPEFCDVRACVAAFAETFSPPPRVIIDPRTTGELPCPAQTLRLALQKLSHGLADDPDARTLVVYELDDPTRHQLRFEIVENGVGITFSPSANPGAPKPADLSKLSILVAEDNVVNQHIATECLRTLGCGCRVVGDGSAAVEAVRGQIFDVIFMDIHMPIMDGLQATREIRALPNGRRAYIAALTAYAMPGDKTRSLDSGMDDYVTKPCRIETLAAILQRAAIRKF